MGGGGEQGWQVRSTTGLIIPSPIQGCDRSDMTSMCGPDIGPCTFGAIREI